jgi:type IV pilus assembly protein PilM
MPSPARPRIACEIAASQVLAARADESGSTVEYYTSRSLPPGAVAPGLAPGNVLATDALREAIAGALSAAGGRSRDIIAVLPDAAVRVVLLDFETLPERAIEAAAIVRFRLKKSVPFDAEHAALSYQAHRANGMVKVVAAVANAAVVTEYETAFREAGYNPGVVVPSTLAAMGLVEAAAPTMVVKVEPTSITVAIAHREELCLFRMLENHHGAGISGAQLSEDVYPSAVFFQDTYGAAIERVLLAGGAPLEQVASALEAQTGARVEEMVTARRVGSSLSGDTIPRSLLAGVAGALVS